MRAQDSVRGQDIVRFNGKKDARHYISVSGIFSMRMVGTRNRNCYEYDLENIVSKKQEEKHSIACVIGDVNGLKAVNDCLGHLEGDRLLENIARIWSDELKSAFKCYRIGGDEFFAFCFDVVEERIQAEIISLERSCEAIKMGENIPVGISIGFTQLEENESLDEMFKRAEQKMYENKKNYYNKSGLERRTQ